MDLDLGLAPCASPPVILVYYMVFFRVFSSCSTSVWPCPVLGGRDIPHHNHPNQLLTKHNNTRSRLLLVCVRSSSSSSIGNRADPIDRYLLPFNLFFYCCCCCWPLHLIRQEHPEEKIQIMIRCFTPPPLDLRSESRTQVRVEEDLAIPRMISAHAFSQNNHI